MASSGVTSSGSDGDLRKRKRMISNRESARRSRLRKQKQLDDLNSQVIDLRNENEQIRSRVSVTAQQILTVDAENSVLRAQMSELSHRLEALNEIISFMNTSNGNYGFSSFGEDWNHLNMVCMNQPVMASADVFGLY